MMLGMLNAWGVFQLHYAGGGYMENEKNLGSESEVGWIGGLQVGCLIAEESARTCI